jgi:hypothetical protein
MVCRLRLGLGSIGAACFDGINGNDWRHEQFAGAGEVLSKLSAGEQAVVTNAVEARGQHVHESSPGTGPGSERPGGIYNIQNQDNVAVVVRFQRNFKQ